MKKAVLFILLSFFVSKTYSQTITYTEVKNPELSKMLAKLVSTNEFGFKTQLLKAYVINNDLGYTKNENPEGAKQSLYISVTQLNGKEITTRLFKTETLINIEFAELSEIKNGYSVILNAGLGEERNQLDFILAIEK
jgi:hypothetical protein